MKEERVLTTWRVRQAVPGDLAALQRGDTPEGADWMDAGRGLQVQEALLREGRIPQEVLVGKVDSCRFIAEEDWVYDCAFAAPEDARRTLLHFAGIDTVADVFLNGAHLAFHDDMYLPLTLEVTDRLRPVNRLTVYFHSPNRVVRERLAALPESVRDKMVNLSVIRKCSQDFVISAT